MRDREMCFVHYEYTNDEVVTFVVVIDTGVTI